MVNLETHKENTRKETICHTCKIMVQGDLKLTEHIKTLQEGITQKTSETAPIIEAKGRIKKPNNFQGIFHRQGGYPHP